MIVKLHLWGYFPFFVRRTHLLCTAGAFVFFSVAGVTSHRTIHAQNLECVRELVKIKKHQHHVSCLLGMLPLSGSVGWLKFVDVLSCGFTTLA